jgi:hypothetical protein
VPTLTPAIWVPIESGGKGASPMDLLSGFSDLHRLDNKYIDKHVVGGRIGVYILDKYQPGPFATHFVGRSDNDVADRLKKWVSDGGFLYFKVKYEPTTKVAYELECQIYHELKPVENIIHPDAPDSTSYACPSASCQKAQKAGGRGNLAA